MSMLWKKAPLASLVVSFVLPACVLAQPAGTAGPGGFAPGGFPGQAGNQQGQNQPLTTSAVNASSDARTNTVVVTGSREQVAQIQKIIKEIDSNPAIENVMHVYKLKNASALNVEAVANLLFNGTGGNNRGTGLGTTLGANRVSSLGSSTVGGGRAGGAGAAGSGLTGATATGTTAVGGGTADAAASGLAGQVSVVADPNTNALLVSVNPKNWDRVKQVLDALDVAVQQVLIKVLIAEVTHDNATDLGAEFSLLNPRLDGAGSLTEGSQGGTRFGIPGLDTGRGGIFQITESNFNATIRALETTGKLDVLSRPYILASDNQLANITVGQQFPYVTDSSINGTTGGVTNSVNYASIGILLDVIPHINPDGMVILDIAPEVSSVSDTRIQISTDVQAAAFPTRSAQTRVAVYDGQTVVIGGLMADQKESTVNKVPLLGDIPIVGNLFKRRTETKSKTELLIFLTPHVARRPDQLEAMGKSEVASTKLIESAVGPGIFDEHQAGLRVGHVAPATAPAATRESAPTLRDRPAPVR